MSLSVDVLFNASVVKFEGQVKKITDDLERFRDTAAAAADTVGSSFEALGVGLSVAGIGAFIKEGIDAADALNDLSDRTGVAVESLSSFQLAISLGDTTSEAFAGALNKLSINVSNNRAEFEALGISAKDPLEAFIELAGVFQSIEDPQQRAAFGAKALAKSYA